MDRRSDSGSDKGGEKLKWKELVRRRGKPVVLLSVMKDEGEGDATGSAGISKEGSERKYVTVTTMDMLEVAEMSKEMVESTIRIGKLTDKVGSGVGNAIKAEVDKISRGQERLLDLVQLLREECIRLRAECKERVKEKEAGESTGGKEEVASLILQKMRGEIKDMVRQVIDEVKVESGRRDRVTYANVASSGQQGCDKIFVPGPSAWKKVGGKRGKVKRGEEGTAEILKIRTEREYKAVTDEIKKIDQKEFGIEVHALRRDANGGIVVKVTGGEENKEKYRREVIGRLKEEQVQIWQRQGYCQIWNLEPGTTAEEVIEGTSEAAGVEKGRIRVTSLGMSSGMVRATVRLPIDAAGRLGRGGKVRVGYVVGRAVEMQFPDRCFQCGETGHLAGNCKSTSLVGKCFFCKESGHLARECPQKKRGGGMVGSGGT